MHECQTVWLAETSSLLKLRPTDALLQITLTLIFSNEINFLKHFDKHELRDKKPRLVQNSYCVILGCVLRLHIHNA